MELREHLQHAITHLRFLSNFIRNVQNEDAKIDLYLIDYLTEEVKKSLKLAEKEIQLKNVYHELMCTAVKISRQYEKGSTVESVYLKKLQKVTLKVNTLLNSPYKEGAE